MSLVERSDGSRDELADVWVLATREEREIIEPLVLDFQHELADDPLEVGDSRDGDLRVAIRPPLVFWFRVSDDGLYVRIVSVHRPVKS